jgi:hypothetical protein
MHIMFARAYVSTMQAQRLCQETFSGRRIPGRKTFSSIDQCLRERPATADRSRQRTV